MAEPKTVTIRINGKAYTADVEPRKLLVDFIREDAGLTGTHIGCEHGVCGACTVLMDGWGVRSCLTFAVTANGREVLTVEGLADGDELHPLQEAFREHHALQCGFCTPGVLMAAYEFLSLNPDPTPQEAREAVAGNLCRCTGYAPIVKAVCAAADRMKGT